MEPYKNNFIIPQTSYSLNILIIGAGIAGLTSAIGLSLSGHHVRIYEQASQITEVGAGIQIAPNAARILRRFGLLDRVMEKANVLKRNSLRRWEDGRELAVVEFGEKIEEKYHAPLAVIHRADLQSILLQAVENLGVQIHLSSKIISADPSFAARLQLESKEWISGDIAICAGGIKSSIRRQTLSAHGIEDQSYPTGDAAYRVLIPEHRMVNDPQALELLASNIGMRWMGPGGHIMAYPIKNNTVYNMVLLHPSKPSTSTHSQTESWTTKGDKREMMDFYKDWNPLVQNLLSYVPDGEVIEWTLNSHPPLERWVEGRCVLVGDACHPMLPYVAQGAAQAIEDAGVLTCALSLISSSSPSDIESALKIYELIRKDRGEKIQSSAAVTRKALHLPDGPEQEKRDEAIWASSNGGNGRNPDLWADSKWQDFMWSVDVMKDCVDNWEKWIAKAQGHHLDGLKATL